MKRIHPTVHSHFTAPYAIGSTLGPNIKAPIVDAALFTTVAALENHKTPTHCNSVFQAVYPSSW